MHEFCELKTMSDDDLLTSLEVMVASEKRLGAAIVVHLAMVETRQLHLALGHSSLYAYAVRQLGFSEDVAYKRIKAARAVRACPEIVGHLESGQLSLSSVLVLAPHLNQRNRDQSCATSELVSQACGKPKREVERLVADMFPESNRPRGGTTLQPVADGKTRLEITISETCDALLREAMDLDGHRDPEASESLERALGDYVARRKAERYGQTTRPQKNPRPCDLDAVSQKTRRQVYERDGGRCSFVSKQGRRCGSTHKLEFDHVIPRAAGGESTEDNIRMLCRSHNQHVAAEVLGRQRVENAKGVAMLSRDCCSALMNMGYSKSTAKAAVARLTISANQSISEVVRAGLQAARRSG